MADNTEAIANDATLDALLLSVTAAKTTAVEAKDDTVQLKADVTALKTQAQTLVTDAEADIPQARDQAVTTIEAARDQATGAVTTARDQALGALDQQETASLTAVQQQQATSTTAVTTARDQALGALDQQETASLTAVQQQQATSVAAVVTQQGLSVQAVVDQEANAAQNLADQEQEISGGLTAREQATIEAAEDAVTVLRGINGAPLNVGAPIGKSVETLHGEALTAATDAETAKAEAEAARDSTVALARATSPFTEAATNADPQLVSDYQEAILDVSITGAKPANDDYYVDRIRRRHYTNATGPWLYFWLIRIHRVSDNALIFQYILSGADADATSPEPENPETPVTITLTSEIDGIAQAKLLIRWSGVTENVGYTGSTGMILRDTCWRDAGQPGAGYAAPLATKALDTRASTLETRTDGAATVRTVAMPENLAAATADARMTYDPSTRTLSVTGLYIGDDEKGGANKRLRLPVASVQFAAATGYQMAWVDLNALRAAANQVGTSAALKVGLATSGVDRYTGLPHQLPLFQRYNDLTYGPAINIPYVDVSKWDADELMLNIVSATELRVYSPMQAGTSHYVECMLKRFTGVDADVWYLAQVWHSKRTGTKSFTRVQALSSEGPEWFSAIKEQGQADHMGGIAHKNEDTQSETLRVNDVGQPLTVGWYPAKTISFVIRSLLTRDSDVNAVLAESQEYLTWGPGYLDAELRVKWLSAVTIQDAYMGMIAPYRYVENTSTTENTASTQITGTAITDEAGWVQHDVSAITSQPGTLVTPRSGVRSVEMWGTAGYSVGMEWLKHPEVPGAAEETFVSLYSGFYNKVYPRIVPIGYVTSANQVWRGKVRYSFGFKG